MVFTDNFTPMTNTCSSPPHEPDDISAFLRQLLHRSSSNISSSSSSSSLFLPTVLSSTTIVGAHAGEDNNKTSLPCLASPPPVVFSTPDRFSLQPSSSLSKYFPVSGGGLVSHLSSNNEYAQQECDYESEEGAEAAVEEAEAEAEAEPRQPPSQNHSKRIRAAEVHNLSEKRRRSRINEKMKALQKLIPNSNKTDKASMLDEAIEYLKQLQLQVQMLSMRNGLSLHPMCLPENEEVMHAPHPSQIGVHNLNNSSTSFDHINISNSTNMIPHTLHSSFNLANRSGSSSTRPFLSGVSNVINSEVAAFGQNSSVHPSFEPFQTRNTPQTVCREPGLPQERSFTSKHELKALVPPMPFQFGAGNSSMEGLHNSLEAHTPAKYESQDLLLENILGQNQRISSTFSGLHAASSSTRNDKLMTERR